MDDVFGGIKDRPVVDVQDVLPSVQSVLFGVVYKAAANMVNGVNVLVNAGDALGLEDASAKPSREKIW